MRVIAFLTLAAGAIAMAVPAGQADTIVATALDDTNTRSIDFHPIDSSTELAKPSDIPKLPPTFETYMKQLGHGNPDNAATGEPVCGVSWSLVDGKWLTEPLFKAPYCHNLSMQSTLYYNNDCGLCRLWVGPNCEGEDTASAQGHGLHAIKPSLSYRCLGIRK